MSQRWYVASTGNHQGLVIEETTGRSVAITYDKADAPLAAAAPDLLAACIDLLGEAVNGPLHDDNGHCVHCGRDNSGYPGLKHCSDDCPGEGARAAIAKARGEMAHEADCPAIDGFSCRCGEG